MWSIIDRTHPVRAHIKRIAIEEMLHMGSMCNLLTSLRGTPVFNTPDTVPTFSGRLPAGVRPELKVWLAGFSRAMIRATYMEIETPEHGPITQFLGRTYPTIGAFYNAIYDAVARLNDSDFTGGRQLESLMLGLTAITNQQEALDAIVIIREQGEGTRTTPFPSSDPASRAHYYRFAEMYFGHELVETSIGWEYSGPTIDLPAAYPMAEVPSTGYPESRDFDRLYTRVLDGLQSAWEHDNQSAMDAAVDIRRDDLEQPARDLLRILRADQAGVLGPSFQIVR